MDLTSKFLLFKKKEVFEKVMSQIPQGLRPIVLIEDTREMWSCGTYFSIGYPSIEITESSGSVKVSIGESYFWLSTSGDSISIRKGEGNRIIINSNALSRVDTLPPLTWNLEQRKLLHMESGAIPGSYGQSSNTGNASIFVVPNISVDSTGHITSIKDVNVEIRDYVELLAPSTTSVDRNVLLSYNLVNTNSDSAQTRKANGLLFNDATKRLTVEGGITSNGLTQVNNGDLVVVGGYIIGNLKGEVEGEAKPKIHLSAKPEYGGASTELYGHVKLQDILNNKPDPSSNNTNVNDTNVVNAIAASPYMVWEALETAKNYADSLLGTNNAMLFKGSITAGTSSPGNFTPAGVVGNTYVVTFSEETYTNSIGYVNGEPVEVGDLVICKKDTSEATSSTWQQIKENWTYVQTNTTGTVSGPSSSTVGLLAVFSNTTGKLIKGLQNGNVGLMLVIGNSGIPEWQDKPDKLAYSLVFKANSSPVIEFDGSSQKTLNLIQGDNVIISYDQLGNVTIAADPGSDTVNTAGATNKINTKLFLIGAESQTTSPETFSNQYVYIGTDNKLYSNEKEVSTTDHLHDDRYVKKSGDTMTGVLTINYNTYPQLKINNGSGGYSMIAFQSSGADKVIMGYSSATGAILQNKEAGNYINIKDSNLLWNNTNAFLHTGNYSSTLDTRYVKKSGDSMTGQLNMQVNGTVPLNINNTNESQESCLRVQSGGVSKSAFGWANVYGTYMYEYTSNKYLYILNGVLRFDGNQVLDTSNYASILDSKYLFHTRQTDLDANLNATSIRTPRIYEILNGTNMPSTNSWHQVFNWGTNDSNYGFQMANCYTIQNADMFYRTKVGGSFGSWIKFLTNNNYSTTLDTRYVKKAGDTMTGSLNTKDLWTGTDIKGVYIEGLSSLGVRLQYLRSTGTYDQIWLKDGSLLFNDNTVWHAGNGGSGSGLDADLLDGVHINSLVYSRIYDITNGLLVKTALLSTIDNMFNIRITGNSYSANAIINTYLEGYNYNSGNNMINCSAINYGLNIPYINVFNYNGYICIWIPYSSRYQTYSVYVECAPTNGNLVASMTNAAMPTSGVTRLVKVIPKVMALTTSNVSSATKLQTPRTIWGKSFDGTGNVDGCLRIQANEGNWREGIRIFPNNGWSTIVLGGSDLSYEYGTSANSWSIHNNNGIFAINRNGSTGHTGYELCNVNGNWGIGTTSPSYKLHVAGTMGVTGATNISVNTTYPLILKGADKFSVINFKNNAGSNVTDIGWLNDTRGNSAYMANISSNGVVSVANDGLWYSNDAGTFRKYSVLHTGNYTSLVVRKAGDTMAGALNFANNVWNRVGDDVYIGDHNVANYLCIKANSGSTVGINFFNSSNGDVGKLASVNGTLQWKGTNISLDGHTHGLLHNNFATTIANTTTDSGWSMINGSYNGFILKSLRTSASAPSWILGNYAAGICFGGADTKGVISVAYSSAQVRVAGGNGSKPVWSCDLWHNKNFNPNTKFNTSGGTISGAVTINNTLSVSKIKATSTYSSNYVFCADGSIRNFPALFSTNILWASYKVNTGGSGSYSRLSGNYTFITGRTREGTGSLIVTISVPSGYSKTQIMMFATGHHRQDHWANPVYASIQPDYGASNSIRIMTADDSSLNDAECIVNFILVKTS